MEQEYHALLRNETWTLVPPPPRVNVIDSKWVFKVKKHSDGSIERYKGVLFPEVFGNAMVLTMRTPLVQRSNLAPSGFFSPLQSLEVGLFISLMCKMLSFMVYWRKRSICASRLVF
jgi:hypothetical protein